MVNLLANMIALTQVPAAKNVFIDPTGGVMGPMLMLAVYLFLLLFPLILILLFFFYKKKLQSQQILAAMEKGLPVKDLLEAPNKKKTGWVSNISAGIGLLFIAILLGIVFSNAGLFEGPELVLTGSILAVIVGLGITRLIRGLFQKAELKKKTDDESDEEEVDTSPPALPAE